jgi:hypothetical protein
MPSNRLASSNCRKTFDLLVLNARISVLFYLTTFQSTPKTAKESKVWAVGKWGNLLRIRFYKLIRLTISKTKILRPSHRGQGAESSITSMSGMLWWSICVLCRVADVLCASLYALYSPFIFAICCHCTSLIYCCLPIYL